MKLLVVSDNHGDKKVLDEILSREIFDQSIHLGDAELSEKYISDNFTYYVSGNHEYFKYWEIGFEIEGVKFIACHGHTIGISMLSSIKPSLKYLHQAEADVMLHGHTHRACDEVHGNKRIICPGSTSLPRGPEGKSYCLITIEDGEIKEVEFKKV